MPDFAANLRRLMARLGLTLETLSQRTDLDERTLKGILSGRSARPQARTLHKLAMGLGVPADELFQHPSLLAHREFDRATNPVVDEAIASEPALFEGWTTAGFDELYSRFGAGGALTADGALQVARAMNRNRATLDQAALILETGEADLLRQIIDTLYQRVLVRPGPCAASACQDATDACRIGGLPARTASAAGGLPVCADHAG